MKLKSCISKTNCYWRVQQSFTCQWSFYSWDGRKVLPNESVNWALAVYYVLSRNNTTCWHVSNLFIVVECMCSLHVVLIETTIIVQLHRVKKVLIIIYIKTYIRNNKNQVRNIWNLPKWRKLLIYLEMLYIKRNAKSKKNSSRSKTFRAENTRVGRLT